MNKYDIRIVVSKPGLQEFIDNTTINRIKKPDIYFETKEQIYIGYNKVFWYHINDSCYEEDCYMHQLFCNFLDYLKNHSRSYNCVILKNGTEDYQEFWNEGEKDNLYLEFPTLKFCFEDQKTINLLKQNIKSALTIVTESQVNTILKNAGFILETNNDCCVKYIPRYGNDFYFHFPSTLSVKKMVRHILNGLSSFKNSTIYVFKENDIIDKKDVLEKVDFLYEDVREIANAIETLKYKLNALLRQGLDVRDYGKIINDIYNRAWISKNDTHFLEASSFEKGYYNQSDLKKLEEDIKRINEQIDIDSKTIIDFGSRYNHIAVFYSNFLDLFSV